MREYVRQTQVGFLSLLLLCFDEELRSGFDLLYPSCPVGLQVGTEEHCQNMCDLQHLKEHMSTYVVG